VDVDGRLMEPFKVCVTPGSDFRSIAACSPPDAAETWAAELDTTLGIEEDPIGEASWVPVTVVDCEGDETRWRVDGSVEYNGDGAGDYVYRYHARRVS
jgi:hypothetical protein